MKRTRTGSFTKMASRAPTLPTLAGAATGANRRLSSAERREVKQLINAAAPKSILHNSANAGVTPVTGALASGIASILAFTNTNQGLAEYQRRGDQIFIRRIHFKCRLFDATSKQNTIRLMIARAATTSGASLPIDWTQVLQNAGAGTPGVVSTIQDDQPYQILWDKTYTCGDKTSVWGDKYVEIKLDFSKRPLKVIYADGTSLGSPANILMGNIELAAATQIGTASMTYVYDLEFTEK